VIERSQGSFPNVITDPSEARIYAAKAAHRGIRTGQRIAKELARFGFRTGRILDLGSGSGEMAIELAKRFPEAEVIGLDLSEPLLDIARLFSEREKLQDRVIFENRDIQKLAFPDCSFDVVVSLNTIHTVDDVLMMLNEIERVLAPPGRLVLCDIKRSWVAKFLPHLRCGYTVDEISIILKNSQLRSWKIFESVQWFTVVTV